MAALQATSSYVTIGLGDLCSGGSRWAQHPPTSAKHAQATSSISISSGGERWPRWHGRSAHCARPEDLDRADNLTVCLPNALRLQAIQMIEYAGLLAKGPLF